MARARSPLSPLSPREAPGDPGGQGSSRGGVTGLPQSSSMNNQPRVNLIGKRPDDPGGGSGLVTSSFSAEIEGNSRKRASQEVACELWIPGKPCDHRRVRSREESEFKGAPEIRGAS